jgi:hypothetical protein
MAMYRHRNFQYGTIFNKVKVNVSNVVAMSLDQLPVKETLSK